MNTPTKGIMNSALPINNKTSQCGLSGGPGLLKSLRRPSNTGKSLMSSNKAIVSVNFQHGLNPHQQKLTGLPFQFSTSGIIINNQQGGNLPPELNNAWNNYSRSCHAKRTWPAQWKHEYEA